VSRRGTHPGSRPARNPAADGRRAGWPWWGVGLVAAAGVVAGIIAWSAFRPSGGTAAGPAGLPGPLGGPSIAQDVNTLVGKPAPVFTLADSDGVSYTVTPRQGKPIVLVSHMGII
jgi:hypothetical protein